MRKTTRFAIASLFAGLILGTAGQTYAGGNFDPTAPDPAPVLDAGWVPDQIDDSFTPSEASPYTFTVPAGSSWIFRITDQFVTGDQYFVYNGAVTPANLILTTSLNGAQAPLTPVGDPTGEAGWESADYQHGQITLGPGNYSLTVEGDGVGGVPAGFYTRLDTGAVPEPSSMMLAATGALGGLLVARARRRKSQA